MMTFSQFLDEAEHTILGQQFGVSAAKKAGDKRGGNTTPINAVGSIKAVNPSRPFMDLGMKCVGTPPIGKKKSTVVGS